MAQLIQIKVVGAKRTLRYLDGIPKKLKNKRGVYLAAVVEYRKWMLKNFKAEGGLHDNKSLKWKKLKQSTIDRRRKGKGGGGTKILQDTGDLRNRWELRATNNRGIIKSGVNYSSDHEEGVKRRKLPQRKIFPRDKQGRQIIAPIFTKFVEKAVKE